MQPRHKSSILPITFFLLAFLPLSASAHITGAMGSAGSGFFSGFMHPFGGLDHILAMLAVGMWAAQLGGRALWMLPGSFLLVMALSGIAGIAGLPLGNVELGIALSVVALGGVVAINVRPSLGIAAMVVTVFAVFHGYSHGAEMSAQMSALSFSAGFVVATGLIILSGIVIGLAARLPHGMKLLRNAGATISIAGIYLVGKMFIG